MYLTILTVLAALAAAFLAFIGVLYLTRGTPIRTTRNLDGEGDPPAIEDEDFLETMQLHLGTAFHDGNDIDILPNGDGVFPCLFEDLAAARDLICWHVFWYKPGKLADRVSEVLRERARAGVTVLFLFDVFGAHGIPDEYFEAMRRDGVEVCSFRPVRWNTLHKAQRRTHTRAVVIDGKVGYTGGFAIEDRWLGDGRSPGHWRDTSVRIDGPAVRQLQAAFAADWAEARGELLVGERVFPSDRWANRDGGRYAGLMYSAPSVGSTPAERFFVLSILGARRRLWITNAYFIPNPAMVRLLESAVERGVDVRVLTPGANTDKKVTWYAGRLHYEELLAAGVRIYEYRPTMVHAKTLVADGAWCAIGTVNFDNRSVALNDEVTLMIHEPGAAERMERLFEEDLEHADELQLERFRERGWGGRMLEYLSYSISRLL